MKLILAQFIVELTVADTDITPIPSYLSHTQAHSQIYTRLYKNDYLHIML